eukprot:SAG31_NODE_1262_length_9072_cov_11.697760_4_plen_55_part_00
MKLVPNHMRHVYLDLNSTARGAGSKISELGSISAPRGFGLEIALRSRSAVCTRL